MEITPAIKQDFITLSDDATVSEFIGQLRQFEKHSALVFRNNKYLGLVEKKKLLRSRLDTTNIKVANFVQKTPLISEHADIIETAYLMYQSNVDFLPVEKSKEIVGVLTAIDLAKLGTELPEMKETTINSAKLIKDIRVSKNDPVATAIQLMHDHAVDHVPVFDNGAFYGIVSYKDILRKYLNWSPKREFSTKFNKLASSRGAEAEMPKLTLLPVSDFSTNENIISVQQKDSLLTAASLLAKNNVASLVVMNGQTFQGLLNVKSILRVLGSLKIPQNFNIQFIGLNDVSLPQEEKKRFQKVASNESFKLQRGIHNDFKLIIHLKEYEKEETKKGKRHKYSVTMRVEFPGQIITSTQDDWDFIKALHKTFNNAQNTINKKFKANSSSMGRYEQR